MGDGESCQHTLLGRTTHNIRRFREINQTNGGEGGGFYYAKDSILGWSRRKKGCVPGGCPSGSSLAGCIGWQHGTAGRLRPLVASAQRELEVAPYRSHAVLHRVKLCRAALRRAVLCCAVLCCTMQCGALVCAAAAATPADVSIRHAGAGGGAGEAGEA